MPLVSWTVVPEGTSAEVRRLDDNAVVASKTGSGSADLAFAKAGEVYVLLALVDGVQYELSRAVAGSVLLNSLSALSLYGRVAVVADDRLDFNSSSSISSAYLNQRIQDNASFALSFELRISSSTLAGDSFNVFVGFGSPINVMGIRLDPKGYLFSFQLRNITVSSTSYARGEIYMNTAQRKVATYDAKGGFIADQWQPVTLSYLKGATGTWALSWNGVRVLTYSDPGNSTWLPLSGSYCGFSYYAYTASTSTGASVRNVNLVAL